MYQFILNCKKLGKVTEEDITIFVSKGFISEKQALDILKEEVKENALNQ